MLQDIGLQEKYGLQNSGGGGGGGVVGVGR